jgi:hypothetical protein
MCREQHSHVLPLVVTAPKVVIEGDEMMVGCAAEPNRPKRLSREHHSALKLLASNPGGLTKSLLLAHDIRSS